MAKISASLLCATIAAALIGCSTGISGRLEYNLVGVWVGRLGGNCDGNCFQQPEISFTLFQQATGVVGFYRCWLGSDECPDPDEGGKVRVLESASPMLSMRVIMKDGSSCLFQGFPDGDEIQGGRTCSTSRGSIRKNWWKLQRAY